MPEKEAKGAGKKSTLKVSFKCQRCKRNRPIEEMRSVTRFSPVLVVCRDCENELR